MNTIEFNKSGVKMIAHRGLSGIECENTNAAFVAAGNRSYFGIETDVHVTADKKFAIIHDDSTGRVHDRDLPVEGSVFSDLQELRLKNPRFDEYRSDYCVPELREYIGICRKYEKICVLEIKNRMEKSDIEEIIEIIRGEDYLDNVIFISFSWDNLVDVRSIVPDSCVQFLINSCDDELFEKLKENRFDLDIYYKGVTPGLVEKLHAEGLEINCWTVDDPSVAEELASWGVDYITSNILE